MVTNNNKPAVFTKSFCLLCIGNLFMAVAFYSVIATLPVYIELVLKGDKSQVGIIMASYTVAALIMRPFAGYFLDRFSRGLIFLIALLIFSLLFNIYIFAASLIILVVLRFIHGLLWGITTTASSTIVVDILPKSRMGEGIGIFGLSMTIAMALGPMLGTFISTGNNFDVMFLSAGLLCTFGWILAIGVKYPQFSSDIPKRHFTLKELFEKKTLPIALNTLITFIPYGAIFSFIVIYGNEIKIETPGLFFLLCAAGIGLTRIVAGKIYDKHGPNKIVPVGLVLQMITFPILALVQNKTGYLVAAIFLGSGMGVLIPSYQAMVNDLVTKEKRGAANSTLFTALDIGIGTGMLSVGIISNFTGLSTAFLLCTVFSLTALALFLSYTTNYFIKNKL